MFGSGFNVTNNFPGVVDSLTIGLMAQNSALPASATRFFGNFPINVQTTAAPCRITILNSCTITECLVECQSFGVAGSGEAWDMFLRVNDAIDFLISTVSLAAARRTWSNLNMGIALVAGDNVIVKSVQPAFVSVPSSNVLSGYFKCVL